MYNILVTGVGGDMGQSICKALKDCQYSSLIVGADIHKNHAGKFLCDEFTTLPRCDDPAYFAELKVLIDKYRIDIFISAVEKELRVFYQNNISGTFNGIPVLMANRKALEIGFDKLKTSEFLSHIGLPFPETFTVKSGININYPAIFKSRDGAGSKQVIVLHEHRDYEYHARKNPGFIVQEYLGSDAQEYTCGLFRSSKGDVRSVTFNRTMSDGFSNYGKVVTIPEVEILLSKLATELDLRGSINIQFRLTDRGPVVFEINPRFSSTVFFRHQMGFKDLVWSIQDAMGIALSDYQPIEAGKSFYRGTIEYYDQAR